MLYQQRLGVLAIHTKARNNQTSVALLPCLENLSGAKIRLLSILNPNSQKRFGFERRNLESEKRDSPCVRNKLRRFLLLVSS